MLKKWKLFTPVLAFSLMLVGCGAQETANPEDVAAEGQEVSQEGYPLTVSPTTASTESEEAGVVAFDDVTFNKAPERIVVFDYGFLDTLDSLGVEGVVGMPKGSTNIPAHLIEKYGSDDVEDLGTLKAIDFEKVAALQPDAVFISGRQSAFYEELKEITPNVLFIGTTSGNYWNEFIDSIDKAGEIFGKQEEAEKLKEQLDEKKAELNEKAAGYGNSLVAMYNDKRISGFGADANSRFNYVYNEYGFKPAADNIEASSHGSNFSYESILSVDPEVLFIVDRTNSEVDVIKADIENDIVKQTQAYKNGKIVYLNGANWYFGGNGFAIEMAKMQEIIDELE